MGGCADASPSALCDQRDTARERISLGGVVSRPDISGIDRISEAQKILFGCDAGGFDALAIYNNICITVRAFACLILASFAIDACVAVLSAVGVAVLLAGVTI